MKNVETSSSESNETAHDLREYLGKEQRQEHEKKGKDDEDEKCSGLGEESSERVSELPEEYYHGLEDLPWNLNSLEESVYLSLPKWVQSALLCNLAGQYGIWTFHNNFLPCRLMSYLFLPYTLAATVIVSVSYRLLCWTKQILQKALRVLTNNRQTVEPFSLLDWKRHLQSRLPPAPSPVLLFPPTLCLSALCTPFVASLSALCSPFLPAFPLKPLALLWLALCAVPRCLLASALKEHLKPAKQVQFLHSQQCSGCLQLSSTNHPYIKSLKTTFFLFNLELEVSCYCQGNVREHLPQTELKVCPAE